MTSPNIPLEQIQNLKANLGVFDPLKPPGTLKDPTMKDQVADYFFPWLAALIFDAEYSHAEWPKDNNNA